ncbi:hypothetical protein B0A52_08684 [Exophiala mesophila]|uniref:RNA polymerase II degradation factor 1 n=1 Tax=Exophiala mesophila TaxID=212818 RepID=A0A438MWP8_EXOME|nr:hypothetical protein B0A52_08684 [Exophiala mesophila]
MAEVSSRGSGTRGRGGFRGGRGGFRGGRTTSRSQHKQENEQENIPPTSLDDQGEIGELKRQFGDKIPLLRDILPGWSDEDLVFALQETDGDVNAAVDRISSGTISQWGEVKKKQPKSKESTTASTDPASRGRGRANADGRGRGRAVDRGGARGARSAKSVTHTNGTKTSKPSDDWDTPAPPTEANGAWGSVPPNGDAPTTTTDDWTHEPGKDALASLQTDEPKPAASALPATAKPGGWAGLFAKPPPPPAPAPQRPPPTTSAPAPPQNEPSAFDAVPAIEDPASVEPAIPPPIEAELSEEGPSELPSAPHSDTGKDLVPSSQDELTEKNLGRLPDSSHPPPSATAASTVASTQDPLAAAESTKPVPRAGLSGYATTALKATGGVGRSASHGRKHIEQQEAVIMPGNLGIEKAAVQFGKLGIGADDVDVDEEREEPETRTQLPDDSPSAPRASLPPSLSESLQPAAVAPTQAPGDIQAAPRHAPGLPPASQQNQPNSQSPGAYTEQYRYGQGQKPYDPFGQQVPSGQAQEPFSNQVPHQPSASGSSTGPISQADYSAYYGRDAYYYGYGQDAHRAGSAFGTSAPDIQGQYATSRPGQQTVGQQETQGSGNNTPAPGVPNPQAQPSAHLQSQNHYPYGYPNAYSQQYPQYSSYFNQAQAQAQAQANHRYGANRPMFDDVRRQDSDYYAGQQYNYGGHGQNHYGGSAYKYGQPQQGYGYEHSASPANIGSLGRDGAYGRTGSAQPSDTQQSISGSTPFGSGADPFGRSSSGFSQSQNLQQHGSHQGSEDPSKAAGPSPSLQGGRPASAVNNTPGQQAGLPQSQHSAQQGFGGYPQYGGNLGTGHQGGHQNSGYGGYGSNTGFGTYGGYGGARGWNGSHGSGH